MLPTVCALKHAARRTGKAVASRIGLPVAASITVAAKIVIIVVASVIRRAFVWSLRVASVGGLFIPIGVHFSFYGEQTRLF
jgi:hypothetical protein